MDVCSCMCNTLNLLYLRGTRDRNRMIKHNLAKLDWLYLILLYTLVHTRALIGRKLCSMREWSTVLMSASRARPCAHLLIFCKRESSFSPWIFASKSIIKLIDSYTAYGSCSLHFFRALVTSCVLSLLLNWARKKLFYLLSIVTVLYFGSFRRLLKLREILNCHRDVFLFNQETMVILVLGIFQGRDIVREIRITGFWSGPQILWDRDHGNEIEISGEINQQN